MTKSSLQIWGALLALTALFIGGPHASGQTPNQTPQLGFSTGTTNRGTTLSYAIVSGNAENGGVPVVQYINAGSDLATAKLQFYRVDAQTTATFTNSTVTLPVVATNNIADGGVIIIRHTTDDSYEKRILTTSTGATNLVVTVAPLGTVVPNDIIYHVTTTRAGLINWGATTNSLGPSSGAIYVGQKGMPLLLEINATTAGEVDVVSGIYLQR